MAKVRHSDTVKRDINWTFKDAYNTALGTTTLTPAKSTQTIRIFYDLMSV